MTHHLINGQNTTSPYITMIENIKKYASELQAFLALNQIQGISMKNENYIQSLIVDDNLKQIKLSFKADADYPLLSLV
jgi:serine kinase of HPr protein (carbohydrate metabolism regulator)